ncbi:hypothetical protein GGR54DRAFT_655190 [Hypoxylon sp. NC1633]|nr:hypothetical protein GGR54DRAFT_655190 [Hypoxylon sp. NC1633]
MDYGMNGESHYHFIPIHTNSAYARPTTSRHASSRQHGHGAPSSSFVEGGQCHDEEQQKQQKQQQRMAADQAYKAAFASHERAVFQEEVRTRARRRDVARNRALFRSAFYKRPEFYAITIGFLGLLYPIVNQYIVQPWLQRSYGM